MTALFPHWDSSHKYKTGGARLVEGDPSDWRMCEIVQLELPLH